MLNNQNTNSIEPINTATKAIHYDVTIYDVLMLFIGISSALAIIMIALNQFNVPLLVGIGVGLTVFSVILSFKRIIYKDDRLAHKSIILILVFAIIFRTGTFTYYMGGQDEGLYVNMSRTLVVNRGMNIYDAFRASLPEDLRNIYDNVNYDNMNDKNSGGINLTDADKSISQIKFYPLPGVWLAIFTAIFGLGKHGYAIQFFSLLVVIGVYFLTLELTNGNRKAAVIAMLFAALNPAFVFFSKFPVSETLAMAFSVNGFYLLGKGLRSADKKKKVFLLVTSSLLLGLFNLVRMSFIVFLPTLAVILIVVFLFSDLRKYRLSVSLYVAGVAILYGLSWLYYYLIQPLVANKTMKIWIIPFLKESWPILVFLLVIGIILVLLGRKFAEQVNNTATWITQKTQEISTWIIPVALLLSIIRVTYSYMHNPFFTFRLSNLYNFMLLISPFSFLFLFAMPFLKIRFDRIQLLLIQTITIAWIALLISGFFNVRYKYYYTRYLTSEVLLYGLILVAIGLSFMLDRGKRYRTTAMVVIVSTVLYFCISSSVQIGRAETEDPQMYYELNNVIKQNDVIVSSVQASLSLPLKYYFGKNVFQLQASDNLLGSEVLNRFYDSGTYDNVYILTHNLYSAGYSVYGLEPVGQYNYEYRYFSDGVHYVPGKNVIPVKLSQFFLPMRFVVEDHAVYLYRLTRDIGFDITRELDIDCRVNGNLGMFAGQGFSSSEADRTWTDGKRAILSIKITNSSLLQTDLDFSMGVNGFTDLVPYQRVTIYANSQEVYTGNIGGEYVTISFPIPVDLVRDQDVLQMEFDLPDASSSAIDPRALGLSFRSITIMPLR
jgi:hypothetical protein